MNKVVALIFLLHASSCCSDKLQPNRSNDTLKRARSNDKVSPPRKPVLENFRMRYVKENDFQYTFYNQHNPNGLEISREHNYRNVIPEILENTPVRFITHGWKATCKEGMCTELKNEYLRNGNDQVIVAEWENLSNELEYFELVEQTGEFAVFFSKVLIPLVEKVRGENVHIVAHGVGAHLCGIAAEITTRATREIIGRITALDPAWPSFEIPAYGLQRSQAAFVDIIHTTAGSAGVPEPRGHVDFYPNGGTAPQPGCREHFMDTAMGVCSSHLSWGWFKNTINNQDKVGYKCSSWRRFTVYYCSFTDVVVFGQGTPNTARGVYHLKISDWPFSSNVY